LPYVTASDSLSAFPRLGFSFCICNYFFKSARYTDDGAY